jgi:DHA1 family bicyclomycin/chloramphenicol resistance-like MFS transporter
MPVLKKVNVRWLIFILGSLSALGPLSIDMYLPSFPRIGLDLNVPISSVESTVAAYFVGLAIGQLFYGPIADRWGRKFPLYLGLNLYILSSVGCALSHRIDMLIGLRFVQALGGCAEMVIARAVVRDLFDERESVSIFSFLMLVMGLAPILAPMLGGALVQSFGWRIIFWILAASGAVCLISVFSFLPETLPADRRQRHGLGKIISTYGILLRSRHFMSYTTSGSLVIAGMFSYIAGSPFVFMKIFGVAPERYGLYFGLNALGLISSAQINRVISRTYQTTAILNGSLLLAAVAGVLLLIDAWTGLGGFLGILLPLFFYIASLGFILPNTIALAMQPYPNHAGSASALFGTFQFAAGAAFSSLVGVFHNQTAVPMASIVAFCGAGAFILPKLFKLTPSSTPR